MEQAERENAVARAEADKKYVKVVPVNPAEMVDEQGNAIDLKDTTKLSEWLLKKYQGRRVDVVDDGRSVAFARKGLEASLKKRGDGHRQVYADLEGLVKNGIYVGYELGNSEHPNVDRQNIYYAAAEINKQVYGVRFKVDIFKGYEKEAGRYKDHIVAEVEIKKPLSLYQDGRRGDVALQNNSDFLIAIPNIRQAFVSKGTTINSQSQEKYKKTVSPKPCI